MENGKIYTYSILRSTTDKFMHLLPYVAAIIEFEDGHKAPVLLEGYKEGTEVRIGQEVKYIGESDSGEPKFSL